MFEYSKEDGTIKLTRGDTAYLDIALFDANGDLMELTGVKIQLSVRADYMSPIVVQIPADDSGSIKICPEHTAELEFGTYRYDIQAVLQNKDVTTYGPYRFKVQPEVTF